MSFKVFENGERQKIKSVGVNDFIACFLLFNFIKKKYWVSSLLMIPISTCGLY